MADNVSNVTLNVSDKGTLEVLTKAANKLRKELEGAQKAAGGVRTPTPVAAARAAVSRESGLARSVGEGGGTGSGSRDFARQAEGLGGLVRVYATFAANIFAVSAAFTALSRAADTANLVKGLDQLGAASGRNLGSLAKQLVATTDGAISLREALTATSQASSGGMSNANILKLGMVAKQASQALGIDMVNAVSRLSRGITKIEPELLDEIGIFVRVDKATNDYARSIGKSASALTDFERRQAFANAVLEQGAAKFGAIDLEVNPYAKIQASLENLAFSGLSVINKVFTPLLNILSSNPVALGAVIAGFANVLLRQAIPAIGQYRQRLAESAQSARELVIQTNALRKDQRYAKESSEGIAIADRLADSKKLAAIAEAEADALKKSKAIRNSIGSQLPKASLASEEELVRLKKLQVKLQEDLAKGTMPPAVLARRNNELAIINKTVSAVQSRIHAEAEMDKIDEKVSNNKLRRFLSQQSAQDRLADAAAAKSQRVNILNNVSAQQPTIGVSASMKELMKQIAMARQGFDALGVPLDNNQKKMSALNGAYTRVIGSAQILGSALGTVVSSLGQFAIIATVIIALGQAIYAFFSKAGKEAEAFSQSTEALTSGLDNVDRTLELIKKKNGSEVISIQSIQAAATALGDLSDATTKAAEDFQKLTSARGSLESAVDGLFSVFGKGDVDKLAEGLSKSVTKSIDNMPIGPAKDKAKRAITEILNVKDVNVLALDKAISSLSDTDAASKGRQIAKVLSDISKESLNSAGNLSSLDGALKETSKLVNDLNNGLKPKDDQGKIGSDLVNRSFEITAALKEPIGGITTLKNIVADTNLLSLLPPSLSSELIKASNEINKVADAVGNANNRVNQAKSALTNLTAKGPGSEGRVSYANDLKIAQSELQNAITAAATAKADAARLTANFSALGSTFFKSGIDKLVVSLKGAMQEGAIIAARGYLSVLKEAGGNTAEEEGKLALQQISTQINLINATFAQVVASKNLEIEIQRSNVLTQMVLAENKLKDAKNPQQIEYGTEQLNKLAKELASVNLQKTLVDSRSTKEFEKAGAPGASEELKQAANATKDFFIMLFGKEGQLAKLYGQATAQKLQNSARTSDEGIDNIKRSNDLNMSRIATEQKLLEIRKSTLTVITSEILAKEAALQIAALEGKYNKDLLENAKKIAKANIVLASKPDNSEAKAALMKSLDEQTEIINARDAEILQVKLANIDKEAAARKAVLDESRAISDRFLAADRSISEAQITSDEDSLNIKEKLGIISEEALVVKRAALETERASIENSTKLLALDRDRADVESKYQTARAKALSLGDEVARAQALAQAESGKSSGLSAIAAEAAAAQIAYGLKLKFIEANKQAGLEIAKQNNLLKDQENSMKSISSLADTLSKVFGDVGDVIGNTFKIIEETSVKRTAMDKEWADNQKKYAKGTDQYEKAKRNYVKQSIDLELDGMADIAGGIKSLFKQKTGAYKTFAAIEKALHAVKMVNTAMGIAMDIKQTVSEVSQSGVRAVAKGQEAVVSALTLPPPYGWIAAGITAAMVASIIGKSIGRGGSMPKGMDAKSQQEVQGTGQQYQSGELVNRSGGALGDNAAKADSVNNSIAKLEEHSFATMEYSNAMLENLKGIKKNTEGLSALILQSGLNTRGLNPDGTTVFGTSNVKVQSADFAHKLVEPVFNALGISKDSGLGKLAGRISTSIFGGKQTTELLDTGVQFEGMFSDITAQLKNGGEGLQALYENIKTTTSGGWFRSSKTAFATEVGSLDRLQSEAFGNIFQGIGDTVKSAATVLGKDAMSITDAMAGFTIDFKTSFKDLKPEELTKALEAEFSVTFNQLAERVLPEFQKFRKPGEEFGDTIVRLARDVQVVSLSLESAGLSSGAAEKYKLAGETIQETTVRIAEGYIDAAGGLDAFVDKTQFFTENFLTEAERLAPVQARVTAEMKRLGLASVDTREEFSKAVKEATAMGPAGSVLLASLLNVAEGFAEVYPELEKTKESLSSLKDRNKELLDQLAKLMLTEEEYTARTTANYTTQEKVLYSLNLALEKQVAIYSDLFNKNKDLVNQLDKVSMSQDAYTEKVTANYTEEQKALYKLNLTLEDQIKTYSDITNKNKDLTNQLDKLTMTEQEYSDKLISGYTDAQKAIVALNASLEAQIKLIGERSTLDKEILSVAVEWFNVNKMSAKAQEITNYLREEEISKLEPANQVMRRRVNALQDEIALMNKLNTMKSTLQTDYLSALSSRTTAADSIRDKVVSLQDEYNAALQNQADIAKEAKDKLKELAESLREFIKEIRTSDLGVGDEANKLAAIKRQYDEELAKSAKGDEKAINSIQTTARKYLELSKNQSRTQLEYSRISGKVLNDIDKVANGIDKKAKSIKVPKVPTVKEKTPEEILAEISRLNSFAFEKGIDLTVNDPITELIKTYNMANEDVSLYQAVAQQLGIELKDAAVTTAEKLTEFVKDYSDAQSALSAAISTGSGAIVAAISGMKGDLASLIKSGGAMAPTLPAIANMPTVGSRMMDPISKIAPIASFASGGTHSGGIRLVGENGPEIEVTPPSRIYSNRQSGNMMTAANDELVNEVRAMRKEMEQLRYSAQKTEEHSRKTKDTLVRVTRDGDTLQTATA